MEEQMAKMAKILLQKKDNLKELTQAKIKCYWNLEKWKLDEFSI